MKFRRKKIEQNRNSVKLVLFIKYQKHFVIAKNDKLYALVSLFATKLVEKIIYLFSGTLYMALPHLA
jgi:hypothetical protein